MKWKRTADGITITNTSKTVMGGIFPIVALLVLGSAFVDWLTAGVPLSESWLALAETAVFAILGVFWLCAGFRKKALTYAYVFDKDGVREKRLIGKDRFIAWADMEECVCQYVGYKGKTYMPVYCMTFISVRPDGVGGKPAVISTPPFTEPQLPVFRDELIAFCDGRRKRYGNLKS